MNFIGLQFLLEFPIFLTFKDDDLGDRKMATQLKHILLCQRTQVQYPRLIMTGSELPVTLSQRLLKCSSGLQGYLYTSSILF